MMQFMRPTYGEYFANQINDDLYTLYMREGSQAQWIADNVTAADMSAKTNGALIRVMNGPLYVANDGTVKLTQAAIDADICCTK